MPDRLPDDLLYMWPEKPRFSSMPIKFFSVGSHEGHQRAKLIKVRDMPVIIFVAGTVHFPIQEAGNVCSAVDDTGDAISEDHVHSACHLFENIPVVASPVRAPLLLAQE